jgi:hypothetical protein
MPKSKEVKPATPAALALHAQIHAVFASTIASQEVEARGLEAFRKFRDLFKPLDKAAVYAATDRQALGLEKGSTAATECTHARALYFVQQVAPSFIDDLIAQGEAEPPKGPRGWAGLIARVYDFKRDYSSESDTRKAVTEALASLPANATVSDVRAAMKAARAATERAHAEAKSAKEAEAKRAKDAAPVAKAQTPAEIAERFAVWLVKHHPDIAGQVVEALPLAYDRALTAAISEAQAKAA